MAHQLDPESLESLCIAIARLKDTDGKSLCVFPQDILQSWAAEQCPRRFQLTQSSSLDEAYDRLLREDLAK